MMKSMIRKKDGYVLAYVLVVVMVVSLIAVVACTTAVRNHDAQLEAISYTRAKYIAEGGVELFAAELQAKAHDYVANVDDRVSDDELSEKLKTIIGADDESLNDDSNDATGIFYTLRGNDKFKSDEYTITVMDKSSGKNDEYTLQPEDLGENANSPLYAYYDIIIESTYGGVKVSAGVRLNFVVSEIGQGDGKAKIDGALFEFTSYRVSTVSDSEVDE